MLKLIKAIKLISLYNISHNTQILHNIQKTSYINELYDMFEVEK
jgi:hypothetical protein